MLLLDVMNETFLVICHPLAFSSLSYHMCCCLLDNAMLHFFCSNSLPQQSGTLRRLNDIAMRGLQAYGLNRIWLSCGVFLSTEYLCRVRRIGAHTLESWSCFIHTVLYSGQQHRIGTWHLHGLPLTTLSQLFNLDHLCTGHRCNLVCFKFQSIGWWMP